MSYIPHTDEDLAKMLSTIGKKSVDEILQEQIPNELLMGENPDFPEGLCESQLFAYLEEIAKKNCSLRELNSFLGAGVYEHYIPAVVDTLSSRGEFYSAYTPYQAEASQGALQAFFEFQTMIAQLVGLDAANASMYDGSTALAEGILMAKNITKKSKVLLPQSLHPEYRQTVQTLLKHQLSFGFVPCCEESGQVELEALEGLLGGDVAAVVVQTPNFFGVMEELDGIASLAHGADALLVVCVVDPLSLGLFEAPGQKGADIVVGEAQSLGNPASLGGPSVGFLAAKRDYLRRMPGRIVGQTVDAEGEVGYVLTLQTREQHIRRERATSNICTNQALLALRTTIYLSLLGRVGFGELSNLCCQRAHYLAREVEGIEGFSLRYRGPFFREFTLVCPLPAEEVVRKCLKHNILAGLPLHRYFSKREDELLVAVSEANSRAKLDAFVGILRKLG